MNEAKLVLLGYKAIRYLSIAGGNCVKSFRVNIIVIYAVFHIFIRCFLLFLLWGTR